MKCFAHYVICMGFMCSLAAGFDWKDGSVMEPEVDNTLSKISILPKKWEGREFRHHKYKHGNILQHNEVEHRLNDLTTPPKVSGTESSPAVQSATTSTIPKKATELDTLRTWVRDIPKGMFNMKNRMRLASVFLEAHSKEEVVDRLSRASGITKPRRRKQGRRRRKGSKTRVAYHPLLRFVDINERKEDGSWKVKAGK